MKIGYLGAFVAPPSIEAGLLSPWAALRIIFNLGDGRSVSKPDRSLFRSRAILHLRRATGAGGP
jgi:hypothetical protein